MKLTLDYEKYTSIARQAIADGQVLLENRDRTLPIKKGAKVALFGRMQFHYYKSGTGSGGMVNVNRVVGFYEAFKEAEEQGALSIYEPLSDVYRAWEEEHPFIDGVGWGTEPRSQEEMPIDSAVVADAALNAEYAVIFFSRLAGEDSDNTATKGCYYLSDLEEELMQKVRAAFKKVIVVLNVGNIIDMNFVKKFDIDAVLYAWQGGMLGGYGTADVLTGTVNPSGRMTDTLAKSIESYPSNANFGDPDEAIYAEDIFVGYRYFETFAKDEVLYPFGYGLSYTDFSMDTDSVVMARDYVSVSVHVTNVGFVPGREVVQVYICPPEGRLSKSARTLAAFAKTQQLSPAGSQIVHIDVPFKNFSSFDESNACGLGTGFVLEAGRYAVCVGENVRDAREVGGFEIAENTLVEALENALGPVKGFKRMANRGGELVYEEVLPRTDSQAMRRLNELPEELAQTEDKGYKLIDVKDGRVTMKNFVAQLSDEELCTIIRGEGMSSKQVTAGTAAAFGGVVPSLRDKGIPIGCMDDGPSGMRLDSGMKAFSLPCGTLLACTFDTELNEQLFDCLGVEMVRNKVDVLLGPGMNIHRHPLNGRNFEYFSEDPVLTGMIGSAQLRGLRANGVTGTIKHFIGNNQETNRRYVDSVISERALREIYLRGFEMAVKEGADSVMTTYGRVNGLWTAGSYDLCTTILRKQWGFKGIVMTDWWAYVTGPNIPGADNDFAQMIRSQNDLYCVVPTGEPDGVDNAYSSLKDGTLTRGELQRTAMNICHFFLDKDILNRLRGEGAEVEVLNADAGYDDEVPEVEYISTDENDRCVIDFTSLDCAKGSRYYFGLTITKMGPYRVTLEGCGDKGKELAQLPVMLFCNSTPVSCFTYRGDGQWTTREGELYGYTSNNILYMYFTLGGLKLGRMTIEPKENNP